MTHNLNLKQAIDDLAGEAHELNCMAYLLSDSLNAVFGAEIKDLKTISVTRTDREVTGFGMGELIARSQRVVELADKALALTYPTS